MAWGLLDQCTKSGGRSTKRGSRSGRSCSRNCRGSNRSSCRRSIGVVGILVVRGDGGQKTGQLGDPGQLDNWPQDHQTTGQLDDWRRDYRTTGKTGRLGDPGQLDNWTTGGGSAQSCGNHSRSETEKSMVVAVVEAAVVVAAVVAAAVVVVAVVEASWS